MGQPSYHKHHRHKDLAVRPHRDVEEPVKEEDEHGRGVVEEDVVPGHHNHQNHNGDQQKKNKNSLEVSGEVEVDDDARLVLFVACIVPGVVLIHNKNYFDTHKLD